jgi:3-mercaptopropionate dioxygenase
MTIARLRDFVAAMTRLVEHDGNAETAVLSPARDLLVGLVARDDWLPERFAAADAVKYRQYLLYGDPLDRFSLVSFVWGPGQRTPVHDHLMWGLVGMLRGVEEATVFTPAPFGTAPFGTAPSGTAPFGTAPSGTAPSGTAPSGTAPSGTAPSGTAPGTSLGTSFGISWGLVPGEPHVLRPGQVTAVSPRLGDIHVVANALADRPSISIHLYGGNIGTARRHCFDPATGAVAEFVSGYSDDDVPCLWARG